MTNTNNDSELLAVDTTDAKIDPASPPEPAKKAGTTSTKNALTHGVYATDFVLPIESQDDFEALLSSFKAEWKPEGASEEQAVIELTNATWIGWRAARMAHLQFHRAPFGMESIKAGKTSWQDILHHETVELPEQLKSAASHIDELLESFKSLLEVTRNRPYSTETQDGKDSQMRNLKLSQDVSSTIEDFKKMVATIDKFVFIATRHWTMFDKAYDPEFIEQQLRVMAAVGARIDKILRRLTALKEYKRVAAEYSPRGLIEERAVASELNCVPAKASGPKKTSGSTANEGEGSEKAGA